jgi:hypothetical protein
MYRFPRVIFNSSLIRSQKIMAKYRLGRHSFQGEFVQNPEGVPNSSSVLLFFSFFLTVPSQNKFPSFFAHLSFVPFWVAAIDLQLDGPSFPPLPYSRQGWHFL